jgi:hypothetical protein
VAKWWPHCGGFPCGQFLRFGPIEILHFQVDLCEKSRIPFLKKSKIFLDKGSDIGHNIRGLYFVLLDCRYYKNKNKRTLANEFSKNFPLYNF